jgi:hypothetical protein
VILSKDSGRRGLALGSELVEALGPPNKEEALARACALAGTSRRRGLNRSKLISRQKNIQVPTAELQTTEFASIPAFMHSDVLMLLGKEMNFGLSREKKV